jgi:pimeloyl-ACP methyl ester carboxylesterase
MHHVIGGSGPPLVLLHSFSETWFCWRAIMPDLCSRHTVNAIDLRGLRDTTGPIASYDKVRLARYVHRLLETLGYSGEIQVAGHDFGVAIEFAPATQWRHQYSRLFLMDFPITEGTPTALNRSKPCRSIFHSQEPLFEQVVAGRERLWLEYLYRHLSPGEVHPITNTTRRCGRIRPRIQPPRCVTQWLALLPGVAARRTRQPAPGGAAPSASRSMSSPKHPCSAVSSHRSGSFAPNATGVAFQTGYWMVHEAPELVLAEMKSVFQRVGD